jgi:SAM-dependent methyltransferase
MSDPKDVVRRGYDSIVERFNEWADSFETPERAWLDKLQARLHQGSDVLDLGCGGGRHGAQAIAAQHRYTGVDISQAQIERARERLPDSTFVCADVTMLELEPESFDAVVSLFMFGHIPRDEQAPLLGRIRGWLRPGGWFLTTMGTGDSEDVVEEDWLGAPMFFASFDEETNHKLLLEAGFDVEETRVVPFEEPGHGLVRFMWALARRPT